MEISNNQIHLNILFISCKEKSLIQTFKIECRSLHTTLREAQVKLTVLGAIRGEVEERKKP